MLRAGALGRLSPRQMSDPGQQARRRHAISIGTACRAEASPGSRTGSRTPSTQVASRNKGDGGLKHGVGCVRLPQPKRSWGERPTLVRDLLAPSRLNSVHSMCSGAVQKTRSQKAESQRERERESGQQGRGRGGDFVMALSMSGCGPGRGTARFPVDSCHIRSVHGAVKRNEVITLISQQKEMLELLHAELQEMRAGRQWPHALQLQVSGAQERRRSWESQAHLAIDTVARDAHPSVGTSD